jgi:hypothetical protein
MPSGIRYCAFGWVVQGESGPTRMPNTGWIKEKHRYGVTGNRLAGKVLSPSRRHSWGLGVHLWPWQRPLHVWNSSGTSWPWKMKSPSSFKLSVTTHPMTQCHIPEDLNPQKQCYENPQILHMSNFQTMMPKTLFWLWCIHGTWVEDGTHYTSCSHQRHLKICPTMAPRLLSQHGISVTFL